MKYLGGKSRIAPLIVEQIIQLWRSDMTYLEPFVGAGSVLARFCRAVPHAKKIASDIHPDLILMWQALQQGWIPPETVSRAEYMQLKHQPSSALRGFAGFGCAFGGDWFHGYATSTKGENFAQQSRNSLLRKVTHMQNVEFQQCSYDSHRPCACLVYCDPPYKDTSKYSNAFDHGVFWDVMRHWAENNLVLVSEYNAPDDVPVLASWTRQQELRTNGVERKAVVEKLFILRQPTATREG